MRGVTVLAVFAVAFLVAPAIATGEDCPAEKAFVCGEDDVTYQNPCLAKVQGVEVAHAGPCSEDDDKSSASPANLLNTKYLVTKGTIKAKDITRFQDEGFKFVARMKLVDEVTIPTVARNTEGSSSKSSGPLFATRITRSGHLYVQGEAAAKAAIGAALAKLPKGATSFAGSKPTKNITSSRKLLVWGADGRTQQTAWQWPYTTVGQLMSVGSTGAGSSCSAALIGPATLLTAGHCVYDGVNKAWSRALDFYPWRTSSSSNTRHSWTWATTYWNNAYGCSASGGCPLDAFKYDVAVVRLGTNIGYTYGWLGFWYNCNWASYSGMQSAGYPGDKPWATMWKTGGTLNGFNGCDSGIWDGTNGVVASDLDIYPGQSGSNVWDPQGYTRALVNAMGWDGRAYHRTMTKSVVNWVLANRV